MFGINSASIDTFKEYFFQHGVFTYKSLAQPVEEYFQVLDFFKSCQILKKWLFECVPYCGFGKKDPQSNLEKMFAQLRRGQTPTT